MLTPRKIPSRPMRRKPHEPAAPREDRPMAPLTLSRALVRGTYAGRSSGVAVEKENAIVSEPYRRLVRAMPCARCGWPPPSQFCHTDLGKGTGLKTDDRGGWPGCGLHEEGDQLVNGCHWLIGTSGTIPREQKRALEARYAKQTRTAIVNAGDWPAKLPLWDEGEKA